MTAAFPTLGDSVTSYSAYHHVGMQPGTHLGLPSPSITVVLGVGAPTQIVATPERPNLAELSASCGYFDQAHMAREWNLLAGVPASAWWAKEGVQFFQASADAGTAS
jgi:hypothetical protein